jgi:hypothetical protein
MIAHLIIHFELLSHLLTFLDQINRFTKINIPFSSCIFYFHHLFQQISFCSLIVYKRPFSYILSIYL